MKLLNVQSILCSVVLLSAISLCGYWDSSYFKPEEPKKVELETFKTKSPSAISDFPGQGYVPQTPPRKNESGDQKNNKKN